MIWWNHREGPIGSVEKYINEDKLDAIISTIISRVANLDHHNHPSPTTDILLPAPPSPLIANNVNTNASRPFLILL